MASIRKNTDGSMEVRFQMNGQRKSFYPGAECTKKQAQSIALKLDKLVFAVSQSEAPAADIAEWLVSLNDKQHAKLASWGLVTPRSSARQSRSLRAWCDDYVTKGKRKPSTNTQIKIAANNLCKFFGDDRLINTITKGSAEDYRIWLQTEARGDDANGNKRGLAHNTVRRRMGRAKEIFARAVRHKLIIENPFGDEVSAVGTNVERQFFVPKEWIERCIKATDCEDLKIIFAFARYGGMRRHECLIQKWEDIDIPKRQMTIRSDKSPPSRVCPIFDELLPHLMRAREMAPEGAVYVQSRFLADANPLTTLVKIVERAGLNPWEKLLQNLRATRETELMAEYPIKDVAGWIGNSVPVAMKHYAMQMEASFKKAINSGGAEKLPPQIPPHSTAVYSNQEHSERIPNTANTNEKGPLILTEGPTDYPARTRMYLSHQPLKLLLSYFYAYMVTF